MRIFLDLVFPRNEWGSDRPVETSSARVGGHYLTAKHLNYLRIIKSPVCEICGFPIHGQVDGPVNACDHCLHLKPVFEGNRSIFTVNRLGREMIHELKYRDGRYLREDVIWLLQQSPLWRDWVRDSLLVPVPLHPKKHRMRGYNQSEWLAHWFAEASESALQVELLLKRIQNTKSQTQMDRESRAANIKGAFEVDSRIQSSLKKEMIITLVDDVFTTGSTLNECARDLRKAGFHQIRCLTLGHG